MLALEGDSDGCPAKSRVPEQLARRLDFPAALSITVGTMLGSGIYFKANLLAQTLGRLDWILLAWLAGGLIALLGALVYAELATALPRAGGAYVYVHRAFGPFWAYLLGWSSFIFARAAAAGALAVGAAELAGIRGAAQTAAAVATLLALTAIHVRGVEKAGLLQTGTTLIKVLGLLVITGAALGATPNEASTPANLNLSLGAAMLAVLWAYDGWYNVAAVAEEVTEPRRLPLILVGGVLLVTVLYLTANLAFYQVIPVAQMAAVEQPGQAVSEAALGPTGGLIFRVLITLSVLGTLNAGLICGPRIFYAMARDGLFFKSLGLLNRHQVPARASWLFAGWSAALVVMAACMPDDFRLFDRLTHWVMLGVLFFSTLTVASIFALRAREPELERPYRCPGYPLVPLLFMLLSISIGITACLERPVPALLGTLLVFTGLPFYRRIRGRAENQEENSGP